EWVQRIGTERLQQITNTLDGGFRPPFESRAHFTAGSLDGIWTVMDSNGNPVFVWQFADGKRHNTSVWYNSRAEVIRELTYDKNIAEGPATLADPRTKKPTSVQLSKGRLPELQTQWLNPRRRQVKQSQQTVLVPAIAELLQHDWWNTAVVADLHPDMEPVRHGPMKQWHRNGQIAFEGNYANGQPVGTFVWYHENGQPQIRGSYADGKRVGPWVWWHSNGMKSSQGEYANDSATGVWTSWASNGQLISRSPVNQGLESEDRLTNAKETDSLQLFDSQETGWGEESISESAPAEFDEQHPIIPSPDDYLAEELDESKLRW
ncbi:MAG: hypothetical protein AAFP90_23035, partial [Planctomycetota bacterium]